MAAVPFGKGTPADSNFGTPAVDTKIDAASASSATKQHLPWVSAVVLITTLVASSSFWVSASVLALACVVGYLHVLVERPRLLYDKQLAPIVGRCHRLCTNIYYTPWALSPHAQATLFALWPQMRCRHRQHNLHRSTEFVPMKDGGQVALDWYSAPASDDESDIAQGSPEVIVLLMPGITGKSGNAYFVRFAKFLYSHHGPKWRCVVKSWRGIGCPLPAAQPRAECWDSHAAQDTIEAAEHIKRRHPESRLVCMGFSHGGNVALAALAHPRGADLFSAGLMVSAPYDLEAAMAYLEKDSWFPYAYINVATLSDEYKKAGSTDVVSANLPGATEGFQQINKLLRLRNLFMHLLVRRPYGTTWHNLITRQYTGHDTTDNYYHSVTKMVQEALTQIKVPVLCLLSEDDPVTPLHTFKHYIHGEGSDEKKACSTSPWVAFSLMKRGGHCGWFYGMRGLSWLDEVTVEFLQACLDEKSR